MTIARPSFPRRAPHPPRPRRFSPEEYHRMADDGYFVNQRVELIDGEILEMSPQNEPHITVISRLMRILSPHISADYELRCQAPLSFGNSEPEPDFAIIKLPKPKDSHPTTALLVIEVADSSLPFDRKKSHLYAAAQIPEYWLINLSSNTVERYTAPTPDPAAPFLSKYATLTHHAVTDSLSPTSIPIPPVLVSSLFGMTP